MADLGVDVHQGSWAICPTCHLYTHIPTSFENVGFQGFSVNISARCQHCGNHFDAAPGGDVVVNTTPSGHLSVVQMTRAAVRYALAEQPTAQDVAKLVAALQKATDEGASVPDAVASVQSFPRLEAWAKANPTAAALIGGLLVILLTALVNRAVEGGPEAPPTEPPEVHVHLDQPDQSLLSQLIEDALRLIDPPAPDTPST